MRLDRFISKHSEYGHQQAKRLIAGGQVRVNGLVITDLRAEIDRFMCVELDGQRLQHQQAHYLMLNKPGGYLSATSDPQPAELRTNLHLAGRLDRATTGLLLLTNDGLWSRRITAPEQKIAKVYRVTTAEPINPEAEARFAAGIWLAREGVLTSPARLERISPCEALLTIYEGRHHQVKRMFAAVDNEVTALHRESMGSIRLDPDLAPGQYRALTRTELRLD
jgi:16S rRNA pseudouridine516 synthase